MDRITFGIPRFAEVSEDLSALRYSAVHLDRLIQLHY